MSCSFILRENFRTDVQGPKAVVVDLKDEDVSMRLKSHEFTFKKGDHDWVA